MKNMSFDDFISLKEEKHNSFVTLEGYLYHKLDVAGNKGIYVYKVVDDYGNEFYLEIDDDEQKGLFVKNVITEKVYSVSGMFRKFDDLIEVYEIKETERPFEMREKVILVEKVVRK